MGRREDFIKSPSLVSGFLVSCLKCLLTKLKCVEQSLQPWVFSDLVVKGVGGVSTHGRERKGTPSRVPSEYAALLIHVIED